MTLRITAGKFRGRVIQTVPDNAVRPTTGKVRESVFQIIGSRLPDAVFLDVFAGSGLMGFEALSRGVARVVSLELNAKHRNFILKTAQMLGLTEQEYDCRLGDACQIADVIRPGDLRALNKEAERVAGGDSEADLKERERVAGSDSEAILNGADVVFVDPPFKMENIEAIVQQIFDEGLIKKDGILLWEYPSRYEPKPIPGVTCIDTRHYGDSCVGFYEFVRT